MIQFPLLNSWQVCVIASNLCGGIFDVEHKQDRLLELVSALEDPSLWQDHANAQNLSRERANLEKTLRPIQSMNTAVSDALELIQIAIDEDDSETIGLIQDEGVSIQEQLDKLEFESIFSGEMDSADVFVDIKPGAGGTESQDWAEMLLRMYRGWAISKGYKVETVELSLGEEAGIKSATLKISGDYAYGWIRTENGIHRLVRKSPFNAGQRRHTSFASVMAYPEVDQNIEIEIDPNDLRIDTYRSSGAGGQHVNKTDSAVRITHKPSGVVVQCQNDRSQHRNRAQAMAMLRARLYEIERQKNAEEKQKLEDKKPDISWGNQIRSYTLDQSRIKDHRTGVETGNINAVLEGDIDLFIEASLRAGF